MSVAVTTDFKVIGRCDEKSSVVIAGAAFHTASSARPSITGATVVGCAISRISCGARFRDA